MMPYVKAFSQRYGAEIILLNVVDPVYVIPETGISPAALISLPKWLLEQRAAQLENFAAADLSGLPVRRLSYEGDPESQIVATAQSESVDLVIMATHGHGVFRRFLIGSVAAKVIHDLDCPVLTGTHTQERAYPNPAGLENIVCALDLNPESEQILAWAVYVAEVFAASLRIVYVAPGSDPKLDAGASGKSRDQVREVMTAEIAKIRPASALPNPEIFIEQGEVAQAVCHFAEDRGAELLVVGRASRTEQAERLNTNTYAIIRQSPCPVLSV